MSAWRDGPLLSARERADLRALQSYRVSVVNSRVSAVSIGAYLLLAEFYVQFQPSETVVDVGSLILLPIVFVSFMTSTVTSIVLTFAKRRVLGGRFPALGERNEMRWIWLRDVLWLRQQP